MEFLCKLSCSMHFQCACLLCCSFVYFLALYLFAFLLSWLSAWWTCLLSYFFDRELFSSLLTLLVVCSFAASVLPFLISYFRACLQFPTLFLGFLIDCFLTIYLLAFLMSLLWVLFQFAPSHFFIARILATCLFGSSTSLLYKSLQFVNLHPYFVAHFLLPCFLYFKH